jgi:pimeloyl-ACP methyl ester carboxylesterase
MRVWLAVLVAGWATDAAAAGVAGAAPEPAKSWLDVPVAERCDRLFAELGEPPRRLHLPNATVRFLDLGPTTGENAPTFLLVHGYGGNLCSFGPMITELIQRYRVLAFDLPGFGESGSPDPRYTIDSYVETLRELLDRIAPGPVHLVCHSLGGHVCIGAALTQPRYIATLTLIDTAGTFDTAAFVKQIAKQKGGVNLGQMAMRRGRSLVDWTAGDQDLLRRFFISSPTIWTAVSSFRANYHEQIGGIRVPTLVLWGMDDPLFPVEGAAFLKENIPGAELHVLEGAGHCPNESHPTVVIDLIEKFLRDQKAASP